ncbi:porin family protein [Winogradskyella tangerina]|uniref:porin family protein n=1 Tax=Winogradskyella tangerina TaxID=2023240 RepID=UPI000DBE5E44|nr:porin family protein [Winogradskyella tangerina]
MKKLSLSLIFLFCLSLTTYAQDLNFGAKAGLNLAGISFESDSYSTSSRIGFHVGGFVNYKFDEKFAVQPEIYFSTGGNEWDFNNGSTTGEIKTSNLVIPVLLQYSIVQNLVAEAGLQYSALLSIEQQIDGFSDGFEDISEFYKSGTVGAAIGAIYQLDTLVPGLSAGLRFSFDLSNINSEDVDAGNLRQNAFQVNILYTIPK